jgi:putative peptide zinc metalloprotease protein
LLEGRREITTSEQPTQVVRADANGTGTPPRLAEGLELVGEYEESGFKEAPYIARRADGQMVQLPELLYALAEQIDGRRGWEELSKAFSERIQRQVGPDDVRMLVDEKLRPLGIVANEDGSRAEALETADPLLGLNFRAAVVPKWLTRALTTVFRPLFHPLAIVAVLTGLLAVDVWVFVLHGIAQPLRELAYNPLLLLMVLGLVVLATALHEIGHATALRYGGGEPGVMGAGIYIVWPAFYTDVTDAYRLDRKGRLRVDLGGVYFNCIFILGVVAAYAVTGFEPLLVLVLVQHMQIFQQFLPFLRLDGYYMLSDLTGVPDMFSRIKPTLKSAIPGRENEPEVEELKPWVRWVTTAWVLFLIPVLVLIFGMLIFNAPRVVATAWDSLQIQLDAIGDGGWETALAIVRSLALVMPLAGAAYSIALVTSRMARGAWSWSEDSLPRRGAVALASGAIAAVAAWVLLPNGEYRPIQPNERGTVQGGVAQLAAVKTGRPALTEERQEQLGGAPTERARRAGTAPAEPAETPRPQDGQPASTTPASTEAPSPTTPAATTSATTETTSTVAETTPAATTPAETTTTPAETTTTPAETTTTTTTTP